MRNSVDTAAAGGRFCDTDDSTRALLERALDGHPLDDTSAVRLLGLPPRSLPALIATAGIVRNRHKGRTVTFSPKIFLPITNLCRDYCAYCTFRRDPGTPGAHTMTPEEVRSACRDGRDAGCIEALMCLGDRPERVFPSYRETLARFGCDSTVEYLDLCCQIALEEGLLPHTNAGILSAAEMRRLKKTNVSLGLMLETISTRLCERGGPHHHAPDKNPVLRLRMLHDAGRLKIPFTTGILIGIGEDAEERVASLRAIGDAHRRFGHVQEIIIQNFRAKAGTRMADGAEPDAWEIAATVAVARLMFPDMNLQAPPNLNPQGHRLLLSAGINDWGGISPLTRDFVNPEAPWPHLRSLAATCRAEGLELAPRLPVYREHLDRAGFVDPALCSRALAVLSAGERFHVE